MSPTITMRELASRFTHYVSELELDRVILTCANGEQPITSVAETKYTTTRKKVLETLAIMAKSKVPENQAGIRSMRERFVKAYPEIGV